MNDKFKVSVILPAYNEEKSIKETIHKISHQLQYFNFEILVIDDGSTDTTLELVSKLAKENDFVKYISFSRNFGHQNAVRAGLENASGDCIISMDADLQHPPELIPEMINKWQEGYDIVYTIRKTDNNNSFFKNITSKLFYKIQNLLSDVKIENGAADFRLVDRKVVSVLSNTSEYDLFLRGFFSWVGFKQCSFTYSPNNRFAGVSKYTFKKMFSLAISGVTSFSIKPLRFSIILGLIISLCSFLYLLFVLFTFIFTNWSMSGWSSIIASVLLLGGIQLIVLGIIGEYIGKIFIQTKNRPSYIIKDKKLD